MSQRGYHHFGIVDDQGDFFEFHCDADDTSECRLESIVQTERGPQRTVIATVSTVIWKTVSVRAIRELITGMEEAERAKKAPTLNIGINRMSPLLGRELAVLLWAFMEDGAEHSLEAILHGWRELAREERWWLFAKAVLPRQRAGIGWRRALFHALSEATESRVASSSPQGGKRTRKGPAVLPEAPRKTKIKENNAGVIPEDQSEETKTTTDRSTPAIVSKQKKKSRKGDAESKHKQLTLF
jgi:hypothetical protein